MSDRRQLVLTRAEALVDLARFDAALAILTPHLAEHPDDVPALLLAAQCRLGLHDPAAARNAARTAVRLAPDSEWVLRVLSMAAQQLLDWDEARLAADRAREAAPLVWAGHVRRASVDVAQRAVVASTWTAARTAVSLAPREPDTHLTLGNVALADGRTGVAIRAFRETLRLDPDNADARNNLAVAAMRRRRWGRATRHLVAALAADPQSEVASRNLRLVARAWLPLVQLACLVGSWIVVIALAGEDVVTDERDVPTVLPNGSTATITLPIDERIVQPSGHVGIVTVAALAVAGVAVAVLLLFRHTAGRGAWTLLGRSDATTRLTLALCGAVTVTLLVTAAVGMPAARPIAIATASVLPVGLAVVAWRRRVTGNRRSTG